MHASTALVLMVITGCLSGSIMSQGKPIQKILIPSNVEATIFIRFQQKVFRRSIYDSRNHGASCDALGVAESGRIDHWKIAFLYSILGFLQEDTTWARHWYWYWIWVNVSERFLGISATLLLLLDYLPFLFSYPGLIEELPKLLDQILTPNQDSGV